jgi:hypothetical protein
MIGGSAGLVYLANVTVATPAGKRHLAQLGWKKMKNPLARRAFVCNNPTLGSKATTRETSAPWEIGS